MARQHVGTAVQAIAYCEIVGAMWSLATFIRAAAHSPGVVIPWSWVIATVALYAMACAAGVLLLRHSELGRLLSLITQILQLFQITLGAVALRFLAGLQASIFILSNRITFYAGLTASLNLWRAPDDVRFAIGLNLVPLAALVVLIRESRGRSTTSHPESRKTKRAAQAHSTAQTLANHGKVLRFVSAATPNQ